MDPVLAVNTSVEGKILEGNSAPVFTRYYFTVPSTNEQALDLDGDGRYDVNGDGFEEGYFSSDSDFDNDDIPDNVDPDIDGDMVPNSSDKDPRDPWIGEVYKDLPERLGQDIIRIYIDVDGNSRSGCDLEGAGNPIGAELFIEFRGRSGVIDSSSAYIFTYDGPITGGPEWEASPIMKNTISAAADKKSLEAQIDMSEVLSSLSIYDLDDIKVYFVILNWYEDVEDVSNNIDWTSEPQAYTRLGIPLSSDMVSEFYKTPGETEEGLTYLTRMYMVLTTIFVLGLAVFLFKSDLLR